MRRAAIALALSALLIHAGCALAALPEKIYEWVGGELHTERLLTASEGSGGAPAQLVGTITRRVYARRSKHGSVDVMLAEGPGFGVLRIPEALGGYRGVFSADTDITLTEVCGRRAMIERHSILPLSLTVAVSPDASLAAESSSVGADELKSIAESVISAMSD